VINDVECVHFLDQLTAAYHCDPPHPILNLDESHWDLVMAGDEVIAQKGAESVQNYVDGDATADFLFSATIIAEDDRLPLILIAKGKSNRCHKQFGRHDTHCSDIRRLDGSLRY
jgi:hypothetical protein